MGRDKSLACRAVFLDRDGIINRNVLNPETGEYEAPLTSADFDFVPGALDALRLLQTAGFKLFLVSNQPNYAKGKSTFADLRAIHEKLVQGLAQGGIEFAHFYYCFHHPQENKNQYSRRCECRKPSPHFLLKARTEFSLDLPRSWMIGDRVTDVECGKRAGTRTILIGNAHSSSIGKAESDVVAPDLLRAAAIILTVG